MTRAVIRHSFTRIIPLALWRQRKSFARRAGRSPRYCGTSLTVIQRVPKNAPMRSGGTQKIRALVSAPAARDRLPTAEATTRKRAAAPVRLTLKVNPVTAKIAREVGALCCRSVRGFVFVASTGRSGTHTLQNLFAAVPECVATFEPDPIMHKQVLRQYNAGDDRLMRRVFRWRKLPRIYRAAA